MREKKVYLPNINNNEVIKPPSKIPKDIWIYWDSKKTPKLIDLCINRVRKLNPEYNIHHLHNKNLENYVKDLEVLRVINNKDILIVQKSDLLRLYLLDEYGGIYIDASIILLHSFDWIYETNEDDTLFVYQSVTHTTDTDKPILENWFLACSPGHPFIRDSKNFLLYILKDYDNLESYLKLLKKDKDVNYQNFKYHTSYHITYFIFIYLRYKNAGKYKFHLLNCNKEDDVCSYLMTSKDPNDIFNKEITSQEYTDIIEKNKMIKLASYNRELVKSIIPVKDSLIDRLNLS